MKRKILLILFFPLTLNLFSSIEPDREFKEGFAFLILKNQEEAKKILEPWISRQKSSLLREAFKALVEGDKLLASSKFESFLEQDERNVEALLGYGLSLEEMYPSYQEFYFKQALKVNPNLSVGRIALGYNLFKQDKIKEAEKEILFALRKENFPVYKYFLFNLYLNAEDWEKGLKVFNEIFPFFPKDWSLPLRMGRLLIKKGIRERGVELLEKAYEINSSSTEILVEIGSALVKDGKFDSAIKYFDRAYSINKNDPLVLKGRGIVLLEKGEIENAHKELLKAWVKKRNDPEISFLLAKSSLIIGKEKEAKEWLLRSVIDGFKEWREISKIPLFKELTTREKVLSFLGLTSIPFYNVEKIEFFGQEEMAIFGKEKKGEGASLFVFGKDGKKLKKITLNEEIKDFFLWEESLFLRTLDKEETKQNIYIVGKNWIPSKLNTQPIDFYEPFLYFAENSFYIWDKEVERAVRRSPFSLPVSPTRRLSFYPDISFNLFQFDRVTKTLKRVSSKGLTSSEIPFIKACRFLEKIHSNSKDFKKLVERGKTLDISSAETIEIFSFPERGAILLNEKGAELIVYVFDLNGKKLKEQKFKMDAIYGYTVLDMDNENFKFLSIASSKKDVLMLFDIKRKKIERLMENVKKFEQTSSGYLLLNEKGELRKLEGFELKGVIKNGVSNFHGEKNALIFEGFDGWLYYSEGNKDIKAIPISSPVIYKLSKEKGVVFSPQADSIFIKMF